MIYLIILTVRLALSSVFCSTGMSTEKDTEATTAATTAAAEETEAPVAAEASSEAAEAAAAAESASGEDGEDQELASIREQMAAWDAVAGKLEAEVGTDAKSAAASASDSDARSIFVSNVDYSTTDAELTEFFASCGAVSRVKILKDKFTGQPKVCFTALLFVLLFIVFYY